MCVRACNIVKTEMVKKLIGQKEEQHYHYIYSQNKINILNIRKEPSGPRRLSEKKGVRGRKWVARYPRTRTAGSVDAILNFNKLPDIAARIRALTRELPMPVNLRIGNYFDHPGPTASHALNRVSDEHNRGCDPLVGDQVFR